MSRSKKKNSAPQPAVSKVRTIPLRRKLFFAGVLTCLFFGMLELLLWAAGVETLLVREDPFRGFSGLVSVFQREGDTYRTRPATVGNTFNEQSFVADKPANGIRIFGMGGSSAYGFPWGAEAAFTGVLGEVLAANYPQRTVEAINASGVSYAMHRLNLVADELLDYEPDVFVIYSGHNEFIEPAFFEALKRRGAARNQVEFLLAQSRLYSSAKSLFGQLREENLTQSERFEARVRRDDANVFTDQQKQEIVAEFRWRLERLVRRAQQAGVRVLVSTVPCNLREWRPQASLLLETMSEAEQRDWAAMLGAGQGKFKAGDYEAAAVDLERAAGLAPDHAETLFELGQAYDALGRWEEAQRYYERACDADASPNRRLSSTNDAIRDVAAETGALLVDADQVFVEQSEHRLVGYNLIEDYVHPTREGHEIIAWQMWEAMAEAGWFEDGKPADRQLFDRVITERRERPIQQNAVWFFNQGVVLLNQGQNQAAIKRFRETLEIEPNYPAAMMNLGGLLIGEGELQEAVQVLQQAIQIDPDYAEAHCQLAMALQSAGQFEEALPHAERALQLNPDYVDGHLVMGMTNKGLRRFAEAEKHYRAAIEKNPGSAEAQNYLGLAIQEAGRPREAIEYFEEALQLKPDFVGAKCNLGLALQSLGDLDAAMRHYHEALSIDPNYAEAHNNLGFAWQQKGEWEKAIQAFRAALKLKPNLAEAQTNLGSVLLYLRRPEEASASFTEALRLNPNYVKAHVGMGNVRLGQGRFAEAVPHYEEALRLQPNAPETHHNLGRAYQYLNRLEQAIAQYQQALRLKPGLAKTHKNLGDVLQRLSRFGEAVSHYEQAIQLQPNYHEACHNLALLLATAPDVQYRNGEQAVALAHQVAEATQYRYALILSTLAAAHAEHGDFATAVEWQTKALELASPTEQAELQRRLELFQQQQPLRIEPS